jgi:hypothetical protein
MESGRNKKNINVPSWIERFVSACFWENLKKNKCRRYAHFISYRNGFDQRVARQQLCKHDPTRNNRWGCVFHVVRPTPSTGNGPMNPQSDTCHVFSPWSMPSNSRTKGLCNPFLGNDSVNTFPRMGQWYATRWHHQQYRLCFPWRLRSAYKRSEFRS